MFPNLKEVLKFQNKKSEYCIVYIMLKWKLQTESQKKKNIFFISTSSLIQ